MVEEKLLSEEEKRSQAIEEVIANAGANLNAAKNKKKKNKKKKNKNKKKAGDDNAENTATAHGTNLSVQS